jgi:hypothetical protein
MTKTEVTHLQNSMNRFAENHPDLGLPPLRIDGDFGRLTKDRVRLIKYLLGYSRKRMVPQVGAPFFKRMNHPTVVEPSWRQTAASVKTGKKRRAKRRRSVRRNRVVAFLKPGVGTFDGVPVAKCAIPVLQWCRHHGWKGRLVSGFRTAKHSEDICISMCGRPSCPGKCAGRSTNHTGNSPARFAMDVSDFVNFGHIVAGCPLQPKVHNALPRDLVHFSPSGN